MQTWTVQWLTATLLETDRLFLEPLVVLHADEMVDVLASPELYRFTGGEPPTLQSLRERYARQVLGQSPDGSAGWLNWTIRPKSTGAAIGFVQSTLTVANGELVADLAWLITPEEQGRGVALESSAAMLGWLKSQGVRVARASISPDHVASVRVAERLGLTPTALTVDGETVWRASLT